jgi:ABC-type transport system substrate-binding protein
VTQDGQIDISNEMEERGVKLNDRTRMSIWYMGFNWLDPVVGGAQNKALRQAISIALDWDEFISIFMNGSAQASQGPIPPGMYGYVEGEKGINPVVSHWSEQRQRPEHRSLEEAKKLLAQAGYPNGRNAKTGEVLTLYFDAMYAGPENKARYDWYRAQFAKLGIELVIRVNDYNRFQDKVQKGSAQIFEWGWNADYPDPENFLFLLYGPNSRKLFGGENTTNYQNQEVDRLFLQMKSIPNGPERQAVIDRMVTLIREDAPWAFAYHDRRYGLRMGWVGPMRPNPMTHDLLKYTYLDPQARLAYQAHWNRPLLWPLALVSLLLLGLVLLVRRVWRGRQSQTAVEVPHV